MKRTFQNHRITAWVLAAAMLLTLLPCVFPTVRAADYDTSGAAVFTFSDTGIAVTGGDSGSYSVDGTQLKISAPGTYVLSGSCSDGSVTVKKGVTGVTLVLNGLTLTAQKTAPIVCAKSTEVTIAAADGTVNTLSDSAENNGDNYPDNEDAENAVIKCKDGSQVTLCGGGTLNISANGKNGIKSGVTTDEEGEAWLLIRDLTLQITANVNDAINAEQLLTVESGNLTIQAGDDAVHCDLTLNIGATNTAGPTITITGCYEGLEGAIVNVYSGNITITAQDDCINAANSDLSGYAFAMNFYGGTIYAYSTEGDGFDSNGTMTISGGSITVWTSNTADNQPLDADGTITITGGTVLAAGGSAGMGMQLQADQSYVIFGSSSMAGGRPDGMGGPGGMGGRPGDSGDTGNTPPEKPENSGNTDNTPPEKPENSGNTDNTPPEKPSDSESSSEAATPPQAPGSSDNAGTPPQGQDGTGSNGTPPALPGGNSADSGDSFRLTSGSVLSITDASGNSLCNASAVCDTSFLFFSSSDVTADASYTLNSGETALSTATAQSGSSQSGNNGLTPPDNNGAAQPSAPDGTASSEETQPTQTLPSTDAASESGSDQSTSGQTPLWPLWVLLLLAAAGIGAGIALLLNKHAAKSKDSQD